MNYKEDDKFANFLVFLGTIIVGLSVGYLYTYPIYKEIVEVGMVVMTVSSFLYLIYQILKK